MKKLLIGAVALLALTACSPLEAETPVTGAWEVAADQSRVALVTIKKGTVAEAHYFKGLSGDVAADGAAKFELDLKSLVTQPDTRMTRMQENLFEVATYPNATITTKLDPAKYSGMKIGERKIETIPLNIDLHGVKTDYDAEVFVTRTGQDSIVVDTTQPIIVEAGDFNLTAGVAKLAELAELDAITPAAPVTFSVTLTRKQ